MWLLQVILKILSNRKIRTIFFIDIYAMNFDSKNATFEKVSMLFAILNTRWHTNALLSIILHLNFVVTPKKQVKNQTSDKYESRYQ